MLAVDAGGSRTRCLLVASDGTVLGRGTSGPGNHILSGWETARGAVSDAVMQASADIDPADVVCAFVGSAGVGPNGEGGAVVEALLRELAPRARVRAAGDIVAAFAGALDSDVGVVVAAGTGSVCYGRNAAGTGCQVGGWGHILGDEGSAYDIAVAALRAGARALDGRGPRTVLVDRIPAVLGVGGFIEVAFRVYGEPMAREAIAGLAPTVAETAAAGDAVAAHLLRHAGAELGRSAVAALRLLELSDVPVAVAYTGAVFDAGEFVAAPFRRAVRSTCPKAAVAAAEAPPIVGAVKLALRELGREWTPALAARLHASLGQEKP